jgi:hypothetical protein
MGKRRKKGEKEKNKRKRNGKVQYMEQKDENNRKERKR